MKIATINLRKLIPNLLIPLAVGLLASLLSGNMTADYARFVQPPLSPPAWVFPVVWTVLYLLMGYAAYLVTSSSNYGTVDAMTSYYIQLAVNFLWPILFFRFELYGLSVFVLALLIVLVIITYIKFSAINKTAGYLLIPYLVWLLFALYLNIGVAVLNR